MKSVRKYLAPVLKERIQLCTPEQQVVFRRMYSHKDLSRPTDEIVDAIPDESLDWALQQVDRTLEIAALSASKGADKNNNQEMNND